MFVSLTGKYFDTSAAAKASGGPTFDYVAFLNAIFGSRHGTFWLVFCPIGKPFPPFPERRDKRMAWLLMKNPSWSTACPIGARADGVREPGFHVYLRAGESPS